MAPRTRGSPGSARKTATPTPTGIARSRAMKAVPSVPKTKVRAPNWLVTGFHARVVRNEIPEWVIEGQDCWTTITRMPTRARGAGAGASARPAGPPPPQGGPPLAAPGRQIVPRPVQPVAGAANGDDLEGHAT